MKVLLTGSTGYIGTRLLQVLVEKGHEIIAFARVPESVFIPEKIKDQVKVIQGDLLEEINLPMDIDVGYYLVHSISLGLIPRSLLRNQVHRKSFS